MATVCLDDLVPLGKARLTLIPRDAKDRPISPATAWRWINKGLRTATGERIKLATIMVGGRPFVTKIAVEEFFSKLTEAREAAAADPTDNAPEEWSESKRDRLRVAGLIE